MAAGSIIVSNSSELTDALKHASGGQTIYLQGGSENYTLSLKNLSFDSAVTLKSLDPSDKAVFNSIKLDNVSNLTVDGVDFNSVGVERASWMTDVFVENSHHISVLNSTMTNAASAFNDGTVAVGTNAVRVKNTDGFVFQNNDVSKYNFGLQITGSDHVDVSKNNIHHLQADGLQFSDVDNVVVDGNYIHDFYASLFSINHNDMIQFYTAGTKTASENVIIRNNTLDSGDGNFTQSIFFGNEEVMKGAGQEMYYKNVLIENNTVYNNNYHGITVDKAIGLTIRGNTVLLNQETPQREFNNETIYIIVKAGSLDVSVLDNIAGRIEIPGVENAQNNIALDYKNPNAENYYLKVLNFSGQIDDTHVAGIKLQEGSSVLEGLLKAGIALGSSLTMPVPAPVENPKDDHTEVTPPIHTQTGTGAADILHGDAGLDILNGGAGNDSLYGEAGNDELYGEGGNDTLQGGAGNDLLSGGDGRDSLYGGDGLDTIHGNADDDQLFGEAGDDHLFGEDGHDLLDGGAGNDVLDGGAGNDKLYGGEGNDQIIGGVGGDRLWGGAGSDTIHGGVGDDLLNGDDGNDALYGEDGIDHLHGNAGDDRLSGGAGNDMLWGEEGNDTLDGGSGRDNYYGGAGRDTFVLNKGEIDDDRINDYKSADDTIDLHGFTQEAYVQRVGGSIFAVHELDGTSTQFRVSVTDGGPIHWVFS